MSLDINTCYETTKAYHTIALYSHVIPVLIAMFLGIFAFTKKRAGLTLVFLAFTTSFSLWLGGDLVDWISPNYSWVYFTWSWLDFINVVFFVLGGYFFILLAHGKVGMKEKMLLSLLIVPAFGITVMGQSVLEFYQPVCEATNSTTLTYYKLFAEAVVALIMLAAFVRAWRASDVAKRVQTGIVLGAILLFFGVFAGTEYVASVSGVYEINLYGLFVLPFFLIVMMFAATNLGIFDFRLLGSQVMAYALIIMSGSQLLFLQDSTQRTLSLITLGISLVFGILLLQNAQKEERVRLRVEELARQLDSANKQQVTLIHFITHQIKGFVTKSRNIFSMIQEGEFGPIPDAMKPMVEEGFRSDTKGVATIQEILNASNIKSGKTTYTMAPFDLTALIAEIVHDLKPAADAKALALNLDLGATPVTLNGDRGQLINAFKNLIDNSIKYTQKGSVAVSLKQEGGKTRFEINDTGVGITSEDMAHLFTEGGHGKESVKVNVESTGFGLYIVKNIIEAHKGRVWAESEGAGKGSRFIVELPA